MWAPGSATQVVLPRGTVAIEDIAVDDRVVAQRDDGPVDTGWTEHATAARSRLRALCAQVRRWGRAAVPAAVLATCGVADAPASDAAVSVYEARSGDWVSASASALVDGDTFLADGQLQVVDGSGVAARAPATQGELAEADATWDAHRLQRAPAVDDWVLVLGAQASGGHQRLVDVVPGDRFAYQGRVYETADVDADGDLEVRETAAVLGRVVHTFASWKDGVIDVAVARDGVTETLSSTADHPFYVPGLGAYVEVAQLEVGTVLRTADGGAATVVELVARDGGFDVYNFEVAGVHNYFVAGEGDGGGVLVHNCGGKPKKGGAYGPVCRNNQGGEVHHMPMKGALKQAEHPLGAGSRASKAPSILMEKADHRRLPSSSGRGQALLEAQATAVREGRFDDAVEMAIDEVRGMFGSKYDDAILEMIDRLPDDR